MAEVIEILQERKELPLFLERDGLIGIELGVAGGWYSRRMCETGLFAQVYGVDVYGDRHQGNRMSFTASGFQAGSGCSSLPFSGFP